MPQDAFNLKYLAEETNMRLSGGRINRIIQTSSDAIIFTVYTGKMTEKLLIDTDPANPRISLTDAEFNSPLTAPNFCMLLRKHLQSAVIKSVLQMEFDRIIKIECESSSEFSDGKSVELFVELMGRYSNLVLTENGKILGCNRGTNFDNGIRPLIVGAKYVLPPTQDKFKPDDDRLIHRFYSFTDGDFSEYVFKNIRGIALSTAKELVFTYLKKTGSKSFEKTSAKEFFEYEKSFLLNAKVNPCVLKKDDKYVDSCVFPYTTSEGKYEFFDSVCKADEVYFENKSREKKFNTKYDRIKSLLNSAEKKNKKKLAAISQRERDAEGAEDNRINGELIINNVYKIKRGDEKCFLENYYDEGELKEIKLDSRLSPSENAKAYFKKYNKQKRTLEALKPQKESIEKELSYIESVKEELFIAKTEEDLNDVYEEMKSAGYTHDTVKEKKQKQEKSFEKTYYINGFTVKVGKNNIGNDKLTGKAKPKDIWLHVKDQHSSHVIIETIGKEVPEKVIINAAKICAYYSKSREELKVEVVYTEKKNVYKPKGAAFGFVNYFNYKSVTVKPDENSLFLKKD